MKRWICILLCLVQAALLTGCASRETGNDIAVSTLPPATTRYDAPDGDDEIAEERTRTLFLPSRDGLHLLSRNVTVAHSETDGETEEILVRRLLAEEEDSQTLSLGGTTRLQLSGNTPVEVSNGICTVNLGPSALQLENSELYVTGLAIASTLCELNEIRHVNILVADQAVGLDIMGNLPMGSMNARPGEDLKVLWEQMDARKTPLGEDPGQVPFSSVATLYFPLEDGNGMMPETRTMSFRGQSPQVMAITLLEALSAGSSFLSGVPDIPDLAMLQEHDPLVSELDDGGRLITLSFTADAENVLRNAGIEMPCMMAAIVYTLTTFIPGITAVSIRIGETLVTSIDNNRQGTIQFTGGMQKRSQYESFLVTRGTLYMAAGNRLKPVKRTLERGTEGNPRILLEALMQGPTRKETAEGIERTLPEGLSGEDILGISLDEDTLLINLSERFAQSIVQAGAEEEQKIAYSMVNTLCFSTGAKYVYFFFEGQQREWLAGNIYWSGQFLNNAGLIEENAG